MYGTGISSSLTERLRRLRHSSQDKRLPESMTESFKTLANEALQLIEESCKDIAVLATALSRPLSALGLAASTDRHINVFPPFSEVDKYLPKLQDAILTRVLPVWQDALAGSEHGSMLYQYFCPTHTPSNRYPSFAAAHAYCTILSLKLDAYGLPLLSQLVERFGVDECHNGIFNELSDLSMNKKIMLWETCVDSLLSLVPKVANAQANTPALTPLLPESYLQSLCKASARLLLRLPVLDDDPYQLRYLFHKLVIHQTFPHSLPTARSQASFFAANHQLLQNPALQEFGHSLGAVFVTMSIADQEALILSLLSHVELVQEPLTNTIEVRRKIARNSIQLAAVFNPLVKLDEQVWRLLASAIGKRGWDVGLTRAVAQWLSRGMDKGVGEMSGASLSQPGLKQLFNRFREVWTSTEHIKHSLLSQHQALSTSLLIVLFSMNDADLCAQSLGNSADFISSVGTYISHLDKSVRRCGMLVAEVVAGKCGKSLDFGDWDGDADGRVWARMTRTLVHNLSLDIDEVCEQDDGHLPSTASSSRTKSPVPPFQGADSDDSLTGYGSEPDSRSPSPSPEDLAAIEADPSLRGSVRKKLAAPVYIIQLLELLRPNGKVEAHDEAERVELGLGCSEVLIRRKQNYGSELEENAAELAMVLLSLQNTYDIDLFEEQRQCALNALIASCPQIAAIALIEQFFMQMYSVNQRFVILNALALGSWELAGLSGGRAQTVEKHELFPSRLLEHRKHSKYIKEEDLPADSVTVRAMLHGIGKPASDMPNSELTKRSPDLIRNRQLRLGSTTRMTRDCNGQLSGPKNKQAGSTLLQFSDLAGEYFIMPLINRFWGFLQDESIREARGKHSAYSSSTSGNAMVLSPAVLAHFLRTLGVMMHAAQNSSLYQSVLAPKAMELGISMGTKAVSLAEEEQKEKEANVLVASLELCLVVLSACIELDGGKVLCLEQPALVSGLGEWAANIVTQLDQGLRFVGGGGKSENTIGRVAAEIALKVDEAVSTWKLSMLNTLSYQR